jgi:hypothetical protein
MPGISTMIGIGVNRHRSSQYWTQTLINTDCLFYASDNTDLLNKVAATHLPNQVTGSSDFLTVTGTGLNARYRTPDNNTYRTADTDCAFWNPDASESTCDGNRLIGYDLSRILVKYGNTSPYTITEIAILKPGVVVTNGMRDHFDLSIWWDNTLSFHGAIKQNRPLIGRYVLPVQPSVPTGVTLTLISGGVRVSCTDTNNGTAQLEIYAQNDGGTSALIQTNAAGVVTYDNTCNPVDLRYYKVRALRGGLYSAFTTELSIAMLGTEIVTNGDFSSAAGWSLGAGWTIANGKASFDSTTANGEYLSRAGSLVSGHKYRIKLDIIDIFGRSGYTKIWPWPGVTVFSAPFVYPIQYNVNTYLLLYQIAGSSVSTIDLSAYGGPNNTASFSLDNFSIKEILMP